MQGRAKNESVTHSGDPSDYEIYQENVHDLEILLGNYWTLRQRISHDKKYQESNVQDPDENEKKLLNNIWARLRDVSAQPELISTYTFGAIGANCCIAAMTILVLQGVVPIYDPDMQILTKAFSEILGSDLNRIICTARATRLTKTHQAMIDTLYDLVAELTSYDSCKLLGMRNSQEDQQVLMAKVKKTNNYIESVKVVLPDESARPMTVNELLKRGADITDRITRESRSIWE